MHWLTEQWDWRNGSLSSAFLPPHHWELTAARWHGSRSGPGSWFWSLTFLSRRSPTRLQCTPDVTHFPSAWCKCWATVAGCVVSPVSANEAFSLFRIVGILVASLSRLRLSWLALNRKYWLSSYLTIRPHLFLYLWDCVLLQVCQIKIKKLLKRNTNWNNMGVKGSESKTETRVLHASQMNWNPDARCCTSQHTQHCHACHISLYNAGLMSIMARWGSIIPVCSL